MPVISLDIEGHLITPGNQYPRIVCMSYQVQGSDEAKLVKRVDAEKLMRRWLSDPSVYLVNHNIVFDLLCFCAADPTFLSLVFDAYSQGRIFDTMVYERLLDVAMGDMPDSKRYSLEALVGQYFGEDVEGKHGEDAWRMRYSELEDVALEHWPEAAVAYAKNDSVLVMRLYHAQVAKMGGVLPDASSQFCASLSLGLMKGWGIMTDPERIIALENKLHHHVDGAILDLVNEGLYRKTTKGYSANTKIIQDRIVAICGPQADKTPTGKIKMDEEVLTLCAPHDAGLKKYLDIAGDKKLLNTYIPLLKKGVRHPLHPFWNPLVLSGRTSCKAPNLQNQPRAPGVRESFTPRPGNVFISCDYHTAELRSLAQVLLWMFGRSEMAKSLISGRDLHLDTAASIRGISYEEAVIRKAAKDHDILSARVLSKALNFGLPGFLGAKAFVIYAAGPDYGINLTIAQSTDLRNKWLNRYPEMRYYFDYITKQCKQGGKAGYTLTQAVSGRIRGGCEPPQAANTFFQGLTADGAKKALFEVLRECYTVSTSPLYGCRVLAFIHDEIFAEAPLAQAAAAAERISEIMVDCMRQYLPDVPVLAEPALMLRWRKKAGDAVYDKAGVLIPWETHPEAQDYLRKEEDDIRKWLRYAA